MAEENVIIRIETSDFGSEYKEGATIGGRRQGDGLMNYSRV